jgi:ubiquinone/menaquinone biosynthesis C-methylase UbiE
VPGIDYSKEVAGEATKRYPKAISMEILILTEAGSNQLPYTDQTFDIVFTRW